MKFNSGFSFSSSLTFIGNDAFYNCAGLTSVNIPSSLTYLGQLAFGGLTGLTAFTGGSENYKVVDGAIYNGNLTTLIQCPAGKTGKFRIATSATTIGTYAFYLTKVTSIIIPTSVTKIERYAFWQAQGISSIEIPSSVVTIECCAFAECSSLKSISLPQNITTIEASTFQSCGLTSVVIPPKVKVIGSNAFIYSSQLQSVTIPPSVTEIGAYAFEQCSSLSAITIPEDVTIGSGAFNDCTNLKTVTYMGTKNPGYNAADFPDSFEVCVPIDYVDPVILGRSVYPNDPEFDDLRKQHNRCFMAFVCSNESGTVEKRLNATEWEDQTVGCDVYQCVNDSDPAHFDSCPLDNPYPECYLSQCQTNKTCSNVSLYNDNVKCMESVVCTDHGWDSVPKDCQSIILANPETPSAINEKTASCYDFECIGEGQCTYSPHSSCGKVCDEEECKANAPAGMQFSNCSSEELVDNVWLASCEYIPIPPVISSSDPMSDSSKTSSSIPPVSDSSKTSSSVSSMSYSSKASSSIPPVSDSSKTSSSVSSVSDSSKTSSSVPPVSDSSKTSSSVTPTSDSSKTSSSVSSTLPYVISEAYHTQCMNWFVMMMTVALTIICLLQ